MLSSLSPRESDTDRGQYTHGWISSISVIVHFLGLTQNQTGAPRQIELPFFSNRGNAVSVTMSMSVSVSVPVLVLQPLAELLEFAHEVPQLFAQRRCDCAAGALTAAACTAALRG